MWVCLLMYGALVSKRVPYLLCGSEFLGSALYYDFLA
jgi:hypothetical protein